MSRGKKIGIKIIGFLLGLVLVIGSSYYLIGYLTNGFTDSIKTFYIEYGEKKILRDSADFEFASGDKFKVTSVAGDTVKYDVAVYVDVREKDGVPFYLGGEPWTWYEATLNKWEVTETAGIVKDGATFTLNNLSIQDIISSRSSSGVVTLPSSLPTGDMFRMDVTVGNQTISLRFRVIVPVEAIAINENHIVF